MSKRIEKEDENWEFGWYFQSAKDKTWVFLKKQVREPVDILMQKIVTLSFFILMKLFD